MALEGKVSGRDIRAANASTTPSPLRALGQAPASAPAAPSGPINSGSPADSDAFTHPHRAAGKTSLAAAPTSAPPAPEAPRVSGVGAPGFGESLIPIWGSGRAGLDAAQNGRPIVAIGYFALAATDVFLVKSLCVAGAKVAMRGAVAGASREAAKNVARNSQSEAVVHLTTPAAAQGIASSQRVGGQWGVFALDASRVPESTLGRQAVTLVPTSLDAAVTVDSNAARYFARPPAFGPISATRRALGVRSTPLGSMDLATSKFVPGEIFRDGVFRTATGSEYGRQVAHQWLLDYGFDALVYTGAKAQLTFVTGAVESTPAPTTKK